MGEGQSEEMSLKAEQSLRTPTSPLPTAFFMEMSSTANYPVTQGAPWEATLTSPSPSSSYSILPASQFYQSVSKISITITNI